MLSEMFRRPRRRKKKKRDVPQDRYDYCKPSIESLETRTTPALISSQTALAPPLLEAGEVQQLLDRAAAATASNDAIITVVDRNGDILGVRVEGGVAPQFQTTGMPQTFAVDGAVAKARTAAFFASDSAPLTSRTIQFISQSTVTQREVESNPNITDPNSTERGPGFVAPIGLGGHFPPRVPFTPQVDLFAIENTNRDSIVHPGADAIKGTGDDILLPARFNINPAFVPAGQDLLAPLSYGETILSQNDLANANIAKPQSRGIATLPGGIPIYEHGTLVGGIGVFFPGQTGFSSAENSILSNDFNPAEPDRTLEAEFIAFTAAASIGELPDGRIDLAGITLDVIGPGGELGPQSLVEYAQQNLGVGQGNPLSGQNLIVAANGAQFKNGSQAPDGWLVTPHDGINLSAQDVQRMIQQGIDEALKVRAQIRLPVGDRTRMVFAVTDLTGEVLGLYRMPDATVFSIDVAVAKARNVSYYNDPNQLQPSDQVAGVPAGAALTARTFRFLSEPFFPEGIDSAPPGPFSILNDGSVDLTTGLNQGPRLPASAFTSVLGFDAFNPGTNFQANTLPQNQNGVVFFPGSSGVYRDIGGNRLIVGGFGVSGDGVNEDDVVTFSGSAGFAAPDNLRADQFLVRDVRLPYLKFPRNPRG